MIYRIPRLTFIAIAGDVVLLILFAALGRRSHDEAGGLAIVATAAPFLAGWFAGAAVLRPVSRDALSTVATSLSRTAVAWLVGAAIGLAIRSVAERHLPPPSFVAVVLLFNGITLGTWHASLSRLRNVL